MTEEKMERVVLSEEELDKTAGGYTYYRAPLGRPKIRKGEHRPFYYKGEWKQLTSNFAEDNAADTYSNDQGNTD